MNINCYAKNKGWLFSDIQHWFQLQGALISHQPQSADAWLCVRTTEAYNSPDITRTVIQVHDVAFNYDVDFFNQCLGVIFTHPVQEWIWTKKKLVVPSMTLPIGTRRNVTIPDHMPQRPTIGFFCSEHKHGSKRSNMFADIITKARTMVDFDVLMIGLQLEHIAHIGTHESRAAGPNDYARIDALVTTSISPAIPLSVYEALAAGKPVITTPRWFPGQDWPNIFTADNQNDIAQHIVNVIHAREQIFSQRVLNSRRPYVLENWVAKCMAFVKDRLNG